MGVVRQSTVETSTEVAIEGDWGNITLVAPHVTVIDAKTLLRDVRKQQARWAPKEPKCLPTCPSSTAGAARRVAPKHLQGRLARSGCVRPLLTSAVVAILQGLVLLVPYLELTSRPQSSALDLSLPNLERLLDAAKGVLWGSSSSVETEWPVCISGQAVPRVYLLGVARSATSSVALDLQGAGAVFTFPGLKESDIFLHNVCNYSGCPAPTEVEKEAFLGVVYNRSCSTRQKTILEGTPGDLGLSGLPPLISGLYGDQAKRLGFVVMYREPLARAHSNWWLFRSVYHRFPTLWYIYHPLTSTFAGYLALQEPKVQRYKADGYKGMAEDFNVVLIYQSLYSLALPAWLQAFDSDQFAIVPMSYYVRSTRTRNAVIDMLASKFGATFSADRLWGRQVTKGMPGIHPSLGQEVNQSTVAHWYAEYFRPDLRHLGRLLAENVPRGLTVAGYPGPGGSGPWAAEEMLAHLCEVFSCRA